ncbi:23S rRNA methyltransferase [Candidatus Peregrinibacteria bacterium CG10_big_fil_rev_8_21_14_0_10_49_24]|nr:MAG: 23S rRNA methyltransferase [Candidatus Peregrinibacteria bacterium CG11_big_fil_rev_8_21_14_0_20_49_14]PIR51435.1 MAG: 23S rRNA methyltransferase [Candidatus Peregrinibacteria bacterium CG10_big_fil_rev_8_21_14_0_10_49_24]PJA67371.1 MAG: 23S rRNA methyltransferase [Candidatus Peregrinibacteria bacterium CG_4_9_14_3_um_filter_49_12]
MPKPYIPNDKWSRLAATEGYRARSVYKLKELDEKFRLLKQGMKVLDLGAAPGSWLQYAAQKVGPKGMVIGLDLQEIAPIEGPVHLFQADITDLSAVEKALNTCDVTSVNIVLSDLAPKTSGIKDIDQWHSIELSQAVEIAAREFLAPGGMCVMKILRGADFDEFFAELKLYWKDVKIQHAKASRDRSREVYVVMRKPSTQRK